MKILRWGAHVALANGFGVLKLSPTAWPDRSGTHPPHARASVSGVASWLSAGGIWGSCVLVWLCRAGILRGALLERIGRLEYAQHATHLCRFDA